jgi:uncharacterized protein (TIGR02217 family)
MAFHEIQFPVDISYGSRGGPEFNTSIVILGSGYEQRNINWSMARARYDVAYGIKTGTELEALIQFFRARYGRAHGFRYKDWSDYGATKHAASELTSTTYQIQKVYTSGSQTYPRNIKKIVSGTVLVYINDTLQESGWSVDNNTGIITFSGAPGGVVTVTFQFDVPVRFDVDYLPTSLDAYNAQGTYFGGASVPLLEIRI